MNVVAVWGRIWYYVNITVSSIHSELLVLIVTSLGLERYRRDEFCNLHDTMPQTNYCLITWCSEDLLVKILSVQQ